MSNDDWMSIPPTDHDERPDESEPPEEQDVEGKLRIMLAAQSLARALKELLPWALSTHDAAKRCDCERCRVVTRAREALAQAGVLL